MPKTGAPEFVPLALLLIVLVLRAKPLPTRGMFEVRRLGHAPRTERLSQTVVVSVVIGAIGLAVLHHNWRAALVTSMIFGIIALSQVVVTGLSGQISLAQLPLAGVAGFLTAELTATGSCRGSVTYPSRSPRLLQHLVRRWSVS
jgi:hypothetical protein